MRGIFLLILMLCGSVLCALDGTWSFSNGPQFPGASGSMKHSGQTVELNADFTKGGSYVAAYHKLNVPLALRDFQFRVKSIASSVAVRFVDSDRQTHQHFFRLTGDPLVWQNLEVPVAGSPEHHWGGKNDGVLRGPITQLALVVHRRDFPAPTGTMSATDFQMVELKAGDSKWTVPLTASAWELNRGTEFAPGADATLSADGVKLNLEVDNSVHGDYAAAVYDLPIALNAKRLNFRMRGANRKVVIRLRDATGQVHNHVLDVSGDASKEQEFRFDVTGAPQHWRGKNDGVFYEPLHSVQFVICGKFYGADKKGATEFSAVTLETDDPAAQLPVWQIVDPSELFRRTGDNSPVSVSVVLPKGTRPEELRYSYRDYTGQEVASGTGRYDATAGTLSAPAPQGRGFFELAYPALRIHVGLAVDDAPPADADEYFAQDSSFSWGDAPSDEQGIRSFLRILKKNGILWNRDRLHWGSVESPSGTSHLENRYGLYRRILKEEGMKGLDTFHETPSWNLEKSSGFENSDPRFNPYPDNLIAAGESWTQIVRNWTAIRALEVWNEPDIFFGRNFPAEYVTAFTKAVSRSFEDASNGVSVVGGVFAHPRTESNFYRTYIDNGLLDDSDVISYHSYADVPLMESQVAAFRQTELDSGTSRAGIPYWITECGKPRPYAGTGRGALVHDLYSAVEITGKAVELRALGFQKYFAFEFKFRREHDNNFGQMDFHRTPMRGMAAYLHLVRVLSHRDYVGDLKGANSVRARVFEGENDLVAVLYNGLKDSRKLSERLPNGLNVLKATGIDGRPLPVKNGMVANADGITYLYLPKTAAKAFVNSDTKAMQLYRMAKEYRPQPRAAKPLVLQSVTDRSGFLITNRGFYVKNYDSVALKVRVNNFGKAAMEFVPAVELPEGVLLLEKPVAVSVPAHGWTDVSLTVKLSIDHGSDFRPVRVGDRNGNATPIAFFLAPYQLQSAVLEAQPSGTKSPADFAKLEALEHWIDFSGETNWVPWQGDKMIPDIEARFRGFYTPEELVVQVLVNDVRHVNPYSAVDAWRGDSIQLAIQQRKANALPLGKKQYHEIVAAKCADGEALYAHIGTPGGRLKQSTMNYRRVGDGYSFYEIRLNGKELGLDLVPGSMLGFSLLVNSDPGTGRAGFLHWGLGISPEKSDILFQLIKLK